MAQSGVYSNSPYAVRQEFGGTDVRGVRLFERPYLRPALATVEPDIHRLIEERVLTG